MTIRFRVWIRRHPGEEWTVFLTAKDERDALTRANEARLGDVDVMVLPTPSDPNDACRPARGGSHGSCPSPKESAAVARGKAVGRAMDHRRTTT